MTTNSEFQSALQAYAAPVADNGFSSQTLDKTKVQDKWRLPVLAGAGVIGALAAMSQMPALWGFLEALSIPSTTPVALTALGVLGFVGWAALDRGWTEVV